METPLSPIKLTPYLSICPDRHPPQKLHSNVGHAKNAVIGRDGWGQGIPQESYIYEWRDNEWYLMYTIPKGTRSRSMPWHKKEDK